MLTVILKSYRGRHGTTVNNITITISPFLANWWIPWNRTVREHKLHCLVSGISAWWQNVTGNVQRKVCCFIFWNTMADGAETILVGFTILCYHWNVGLIIVDWKRRIKIAFLSYSGVSPIVRTVCYHPHPSHSSWNTFYRRGKHTPIGWSKCWRYWKVYLHFQRDICIQKYSYSGARSHSNNHWGSRSVHHSNIQDICRVFVRNLVLSHTFRCKKANLIHKRPAGVATV